MTASQILIKSLRKSYFKVVSKLFFCYFWKLYHRNRNLKISKALLKSKAHQGTNLMTRAATNQRGVSNRGIKRSSGPISRIPGRGSDREGEWSDGSG